MSILSTNKKLIKVGQDYSAGSGISIDDGVISVTGEFGKTYSAGGNVDIYEQGEQLYISSKDWTNDIANASANAYNEAVAQIPDPFNPDYISAQIDNKLNSSDFTTWQNGQYTTDLQTIEGQINNKLDTSSFSDVSGSFLTAHQSLDGYAKEDWVTAQGYITGVDLSPYYTTAEANSLSSMLSGAIDYVSANADNVEVTNVVQSNSGVWNEVTNKLDATAFSNVSGSFYTNDNPSGFITGVDLSNYYTKDETSGKEELADAFANIPVGDPEVNAYVTNNSASLNGTTDLVQNSSGLWNDVAVYQSNSSTYLTAHQDISNKLDTTAFSEVSGDFLTTAFEISQSAKWEEATNAYEQNSGTYLTAISIPESATWNDVSTTVQSNSASWGQGASTSGLVSGTNVVKVPFWEGATQGEYWSACISGDVKVATGYYRNETEFNENAVYSLSSIGADIGNKLNKNTIQNSKTIRSINNNPDNEPYEVFDIAYKRTNFTNGSARDIRLNNNASIEFDGDTVVDFGRLYSATITAETTATGSIHSNRDVEWKVVDFSNGSAILTAGYIAGINHDSIYLFTWEGWGPITNCEATCTVYTSAELAPIAFKDDIPSGGGGVPQSAFDELKQSYDVLSASYATLSSLFATYSGQWLLPNEGEE